MEFYAIRNTNNGRKIITVMKKIFLILVLITSALMIPLQTPAQDKISVAVEATFISAFKEMAADFEEKTGVKVDAAFASSGHLYRQIKSGVPYDVFLSGDEQRPELLQKEGWTEGTFIYARGKTILWSARKDLCKAVSWQEALKDRRIKKIALANPQAEPSGAAAKVAMQKAELWDGLQPKLVNVSDVTEVFQHANASTVDAGFLTASSAAGLQGENGCFLHIPEAPDIIHAACISKNSANKICTELFMIYMMSERAAGIKNKYGYH